MTRSSSAAETPAAADGDDKAVYIHLCLKEVLFGPLDSRGMQEKTIVLFLSLTFATVSKDSWNMTETK